VDTKTNSFYAARRVEKAKRKISSQKALRPLSDFFWLLKKDRKLANLFYGKKPIVGLKDQSRSGREQSLVCKLVWYGFTFEQVDAVLRKAKIGKWVGASHVYRDRTYFVGMRI